MRIYVVIEEVNNVYDLDSKNTVIGAYKDKEEAMKVAQEVVNSHYFFEKAKKLTDAEWRGSKRAAVWFDEDEQIVSVHVDEVELK